MPAMKAKIISGSKNDIKYMDGLADSLVSAILAHRVDLFKVDALLRKGANVEKIVDRNGNTVLMKAIEIRQKAVVRLLIRYHVDVNKGNFSNLTPIRQAYYSGDNDLVAILLEAGAIRP
jgi:ankyrin repeat protein